MSRSYKKTPICTDYKKGRKYFKRKANKRVRKEENIPHGRKYKRYYNTWDIHDYRFRWSKEEAEKDYYKDLTDISHPHTIEYTQRYKNKEEYLNAEWRKWFKDK